MHLLTTEGSTPAGGTFYRVRPFDDTALAAIFAREVLSLLLDPDLINPEFVRKILSWCHTGFKVHSKVRTTKQDARRVTRYMAKPILPLKRLSFDLAQGKVVYQYGERDTERVEMDYLDFIARLTTHIPAKGPVLNSGRPMLRRIAICPLLPCSWPAWIE